MYFYRLEETVDEKKSKKYKKQHTTESSPLPSQSPSKIRHNHLNSKEFTTKDPYAVIPLEETINDEGKRIRQRRHHRRR